MSQLAHRDRTFAVIGAGMIGSSAARWLAKAGLKPALIGPDEPLNPRTHSGVWGSHYDQGRITRISDPDYLWGWLARRSIDAYAAIERESGVLFHHPVGQARITPDPSAPGDTFNSAVDVGRRLGAHMTMLGTQALRETFPFLGIPERAVGYLEHAPAGYVNPRMLVRAQTTSALRFGATRIAQRVMSLARAGGRWRLVFADGTAGSFDRVLVTTGSFSNFLLARKLALEIKPRTVLMASLDTAEQLRLAALPSLIWRLEQHPYFRSFYSAGLAQYADGSVRFKIGGEAHQAPVADSLEALDAHFQGDGTPAEIEALHDVVRRVLPGLRVQAWETKPCVWCSSAHGNPYVDRLDDHLYCTVGDAGAAAKSCVEIGRMGALLAEHDGAWQHPLDRAHFEARFAA